MLTSPLQDANSTPNTNSNPQQKSQNDGGDSKTVGDSGSVNRGQQHDLVPKSEAPDLVHYQNGVFLHGSGTESGDIQTVGNFVLSGQNLSQNLGQNLERNFSHSLGQNSGQSSGQNFVQNSGHNLGQSLGQNLVQNSGQNSGTHNLTQLPESESQNLTIDQLPLNQLQQNQFGIIHPEILASQNLPIHPNTNQIHLTPPIHPQLVPPMIDAHFLGIDAVQAAAVIAQRNSQLSWGTSGVNAQILDSTLSRLVERLFLHKKLHTNEITITVLLLFPVTFQDLQKLHSSRTSHQSSPVSI